MVTGYWNMFKQNIGIMIAVAQLAATQQRFADCRTNSGASAWTSSPHPCGGRRSRATAPSSPRAHAAAIALLFENFTTVFAAVRPGLEISDEDAIATLSTIWKKTLYGF